MIRPPSGTGLFEFVVLATLRAKQLTRGCQPRVSDQGKLTTIAQLEIAAGMVGKLDGHDEPAAPFAFSDGLEANRRDLTRAVADVWTPPGR